MQRVRPMTGWVRIGVCCLLAVSGMALANCAGMPVKAGRLTVSVVPQEIFPGCVVRVEVNAPPGTRQARGHLDIPGSPVMPLKSQDGGATWRFVSQIPVDAVWTPGVYRVIIQAETADGTWLTGETLVTAP